MKSPMIAACLQLRCCLLEIRGGEDAGKLAVARGKNNFASPILAISQVECLPTITAINVLLAGAVAIAALSAPTLTDRARAGRALTTSRASPIARHPHGIPS
jgi:hypothetical protein